MSRVQKGSKSKLTLNSWAERLHPDDYEELRNTFDVFDDDHSGFIDPDEINKVLETLGLDKRNPFVIGIIEGLRDVHKPISFDDFVELVGAKIGDNSSKEGLRIVFNNLDTEGRGVLGFEELKHLARSAGDMMND